MIVLAKKQGSKITDGSNNIFAFEGAKKNAVNSSTNSKDSGGEVSTINNIDKIVENRVNVGLNSAVVAHEEIETEQGSRTTDATSGAHSTSKTSKDSVGDETSHTTIKMFVIFWSYGSNDHYMTSVNWS